jgi:hypothetical protein
MERPEEGEAGGRPPRAPSVGQELLQLRIHRHRRQLAPELEEHIIHKLPKPGEGTIGAGLAESEEETGIGALQPAAAVAVRMNA